MTNSKRIPLALLAAFSALWLTARVRAQTLAIVGAFGEYGGGTSIQHVDLTVDNVMNVASLLNPGNYSIAGHTIPGVTHFPNNVGVSSTNRVLLQLDGLLTGGSLYSSPVLGSAAHWTLVTTNNPATVTIPGPARFFRADP